MRAKVSGKSYVQVDKHGIKFLYHLNQCIPCISRDIACESGQGWHNERVGTIL